jgi:hypothetical protein
MVTPDQRREELGQVQAKGFSGRAACRWMGLSRTVLRYPAKQSNVDQARPGRCGKRASASHALVTGG